MTATNAMKHTNAKTNTNTRPGHRPTLTRTPLTRLPPGYNSEHSQSITKTLQNTSNAQQTLTDGQGNNTAYKKRYSPDTLLVVNYVKFHLTILISNYKKKNFKQEKIMPQSTLTLTGF